MKKVEEKIQKVGESPVKKKRLGFGKPFERDVSEDDPIWGLLIQKKLKAMVEGWEPGRKMSHQLFHALNETLWNIEKLMKSSFSPEDVKRHLIEQETGALNWTVAYREELCRAADGMDAFEKAEFATTLRKEAVEGTTSTQLKNLLYPRDVTTDFNHLQAAMKLIDSARSRLKKTKGNESVNNIEHATMELSSALFNLLMSSAKLYTAEKIVQEVHE